MDHSDLPMAADLVILDIMSWAFCDLMENEAFIKYDVHLEISLLRVYSLVYMNFFAHNFVKVLILIQDSC